MQALVQLIAGFMALLAAAVLSQFGVDIHSSQPAEREVHRSADCRPDKSAAFSADTRRDC